MRNCHSPQEKPRKEHDAYRQDTLPNDADWPHVLEVAE